VCDRWSNRCTVDSSAFVVGQQSAGSKYLIKISSVLNTVSNSLTFKAKELITHSVTFLSCFLELASHLTEMLLLTKLG